jgi:uncharacterized protein (DUF58 family)
VSRAPVAAGLGALLLLAYLTGIRPAFVLAYGLLGLFLLAWIWPHLAIRGVTLRRRLEAGGTTVGDPFEETFEVRRAGLLPAPWVEVVDEGQVRGYQPGRVVSASREPLRWRARGTYRQRGWVTFGPTRLRVREPFGLFSSAARVGQLQRVLVRPRVRALPELLLPAAHHEGVAHRPGHGADYPPETTGVRPYQPGDSYGRIHWPLTQKHGELMSRTFEQPVTADLWIVLDLDEAAHVGTGEESTLEYAVTLAASVALHVLGRGRKVGLIANDGRATLLEPHPAAPQDQVVLDYLAVATADGRRRLAEAVLWDRLRRLPRRALVVITPSPDARWMHMAQTARGRGGALIVFYLDGASFGGPEPELGFHLGADADLYIVRSGDDLGRLVRTRDALRAG